MALLLLLETSGPTTSVALAEVEAKTRRVLAQAEETEHMRHTAVLIPLIHEAFAKTSYTLADLAAVAVSTGPGSYTALRAGYSTAKGLCMSLSIPLLEVDTLGSLADVGIVERPYVGGQVLPVLHARRRELYLASYDAAGARTLPPQAVEINDAWWTSASQLPTLVVGPAAALLREWHSERTNPSLHNFRYHPIGLHAANLIYGAQRAWEAQRYAPLGSSVPLYIKSPHITRAKPRL